MTDHCANARVHTLALKGRIDALNAPGLDEQLEEAGRQHATIVLDMAAVTYVSSSGLRVMLLAHRRQRQANGQLVLCNVPPRIMQILQLAGFDRILTIGSSLAAPEG
jgi:anti-sigma B factor antagonist/stage II sporulation protein AA (anti-sigma F factor antagonist)